MSTVRQFRIAPVPRHAQRGVVLFVALIAMVILAIAGVGLLRAIDTSTGVAGNLAFRQASIAPSNFAIEKAIDALYKSKAIDPVNSPDIPAQNYYQSMQPSERPNGVPAVLAGAWPPSAYPAGFQVDTDPTTGMETRYVIERVCNALVSAELKDRCDLLPPKVSSGGTDNEFGTIPLPAIPHFRVTVRVDLPRTNAVSFVQAFVRGS